MADDENPEEPDFEEVVSALLKVDPNGLSGKHKTPKPVKKATKKKPK